MSIVSHIPYLDFFIKREPSVPSQLTPHKLPDLLVLPNFLSEVQNKR